MPTLDIPIAASADDAQEEVSSGNTVINGISINLRNTNLGGFRFVVPDVASGDTIDAAYLTFISNAGQAYDFDVHVQEVDNAAQFAASNTNISARSRSAASVNASGGASSPATPFQTPSLAALVQAIVDRPGWAAGQAIAFIVDSTLAANSNVRTYDNAPSAAAVLHLEYTAGSSPPAAVVQDVLGAGLIAFPR